MHTIYTTGYRGRTRDAIRREVEQYDAILVDVRYRPYSHLPIWNRDPLATLFGERYLWVPEFGNTNYKTTGTIHLQDAAAGVARVAPLLAERSIILLCVCKDWRGCHRTDVANLLAEHTGAPLEQLGTHQLHLFAEALGGTNNEDRPASVIQSTLG